MNQKGCPNCGRMIDENAKQCPYCQYDFEKIDKMFEKYNEEKKIHVPKYAGFIKRTVAIGLDNLILIIIFTILNALYIHIFYPDTLEYLFNQNETILDQLKKEIIWLLYPVVYLFYCSFRQSSKKMGTIGEKTLGIEIVDEDENPLEFGQALKRNLARLLNTLTLGIGYLIIIFTKKKQDLSDIITHTYAINKVTDEDYNTYKYANPFIRLLAYIIDLSFLWFLNWIYIYGISLLIKYMTQHFDFSDFPQLLHIVTINLSVVIIVITLIYFPYMEKHQGGTIGKLILQIKVTDQKGERIGFFRSLLRMLCSLIESLVPLATILCLITPRKQTLKDIMTKTMVINKH